MNQPQMQHRSAVINGASKHRMDRDMDSRNESVRSDFRSAQPTQPTQMSAEAVPDQQTNCNGGDHTEQGAVKFSGEKVDSLINGGHGPLNERLLFLTACLIGQPVEVQVKNGSVYSGVFHTANAEKDYGIVLKMARRVKGDTLKGRRADTYKDVLKRPVKTFIIHAKDLVQIVAKDVPLSGDGSQNGRSRENRTEILTDSILSQARVGELERELQPWTPDKDDPKDFGLESTFQSTWNRNWDQFEINKTLFGVESTFDEELYTTKLQKGPQTRDLEREALRIAREIEGLSTNNPHLAEERNGQMSMDREFLDEESRFSSVLHSTEMLDAGDDNEDIPSNLHNNDSSSSDDSCPIPVKSEPCMNPTDNESEIRAAGLSSSSNLNEVKNMLKEDLSVVCDSGPNDVAIDKGGDVPVVGMQKRNTHASVSDRSMKHTIKAGSLPSPPVAQLRGDMTRIQALNLDPGLPQVTEDVYREFNEFRQQENAKRGKKQREEQVNELKSFSESLKDFTKDLEPHFPTLSSREGGIKQLETKSTMPVGTVLVAAVCAPPASALPIPNSITSSTNSQCDTETATSTSMHSQLSAMGITSDSSREMTNCSSDVGSTPRLELNPDTLQALGQNSDVPNSPLYSNTSTTAPPSPSSSSGVSTSPTLGRKSSLNPNAKEFKLNPNAKSFTPNFASVRPPSPAVQGPIYVWNGVRSVSPMQAMPLGVSSAPGGVYTPGISTVAVPPPPLPGQTPVKVQPLQQPALGHMFASQQAIRYSSQAPPVQPAQTYLHPSGQLYSQQMMFSQPGQLVYIPPYPQVPPMSPSQPVQAASQQQQQPKHRGAGSQGVQFCVAPQYIAGQQQFIPQVPISQVHSPMPAAPSILTPSVPGLQHPQSIVGGVVPAGQCTTPTPNMNAAMSGMRVGKSSAGLYQ